MDLPTIMPSVLKQMISEITVFKIKISVFENFIAIKYLKFKIMCVNIKYMQLVI